MKKAEVSLGFCAGAVVYLIAGDSIVAARIAASNTIFRASDALSRAATRIESVGQYKLGWLVGQSVLLHLRMRELGSRARGCGCEHPDAYICMIEDPDIERCGCPCHGGSR
jgi:hypothetical protein